MVQVEVYWFDTERLLMRRDSKTVECTIVELFVSFANFFCNLPEPEDW